MNNFMFVAISKSKYCLRGILKNRYQTQNIACVAFWKIKALLFNETLEASPARRLVVEVASGFIEPVLLTPFFSSLFFDFDFDRILIEFWFWSNFDRILVRIDEFWSAVCIQVTYVQRLLECEQLTKIRREILPVSYDNSVCQYFKF